MEEEVNPKNAGAEATRGFVRERSKFIMLYESWKEQVRAARAKDECSDQDLGDMMDAAEQLVTQVRDVYENIRPSQSAPFTEIRRKMDSCSNNRFDGATSEVEREEFEAENTQSKLLQKI